MSIVLFVQNLGVTEEEEEEEEEEEDWDAEKIGEELGSVLFASSTGRKIATVELVLKSIATNYTKYVWREIAFIFFALISA